METERRSGAPNEGGPRLRLHRPGRVQALRLPIARTAGQTEGVRGDVPSVEAVEARAAAALAALRGVAGARGTAQGRRPVGLEEARPALPPDDPRWVLAVRASQMLRGEILPPADRTRLNRVGRSMGLTPFQCSLVLAVVQDAARRGEPLGHAVDTLAMVPSGEPRNPGRRREMQWRRVICITALVLGAETVLAVWWML